MVERERERERERVSRLSGLGTEPFVPSQKHALAVIYNERKRKRIMIACIK